MESSDRCEVYDGLPSLGKTKDDGAAADAEYEHEHVHAVYDSIAAHFSETRYKVRYLILFFRSLGAP